LTTNLLSQNITGKWYGELEVRGQKVPLVIDIQKTANGYSSTMDSPKQNAYGIPMYKTSFASGNLFIMSNQGFSYRGLLYDGEITGKFKQNGLEFPLIFTRDAPIAEVPEKPKKPEETRDFISEDVSFENQEAGITLAGTLTMPLKGGNFPAVVLISGSGPQNRNEEIFGKKPFLVLSDFLTRNGIAVLRFDDRGVAESEGDFSTATTTDFATDVRAAIDYLLTRERIDKNNIGLIGHSEGGIIAPMVTSTSDKVDFLVLLAAPGVPGDELLLMQNEALGKASGMDETQLQAAEKINRGAYDIVMNSPKGSLETDLTEYLKSNTPLKGDRLKKQVNALSRPWYVSLLKHDPRPVLEKTNTPVLALTGGKDLQVPAEANLNAIESALKKGGNSKVTTKMLPGLNHLFQESETGLPSEYGQLGQPFSGGIKEIIVEWIEKQT
jgi:pimeloyl-ACP methyl ester carboxylesterase